MNDEPFFEVDHTGAVFPGVAPVNARPPIDSGRRKIVKVPQIPPAIEMPELRAAVAELDRVRGDLAATSAAVAAANLEANGARQADAAAAAAAFRSGEAVTGPSALDALYKETAGLAARQAAGRLAVAQLEEELAGVLDANRPKYQHRVAEAIEAERLATADALDTYARARARLFATMSVGGWLRGERKWSVTLPELRGLVSSDRPAPRFEAVLESLRRELTW